MKIAYLSVLAAFTLAPNGGVLDNDTDPDGDKIVGAVLVTPPQHGSLTLNPDGTFTYAPNADFHGTDTFLYAPVDETGMQGAPTPVTITVNPVGDPPVGVPDSYETDEDTPLVMPSPVAFIPGDYRVSVTWPEDEGAAENARFTVLVDGQPRATVPVNQRKTPSDFNADGIGWKVLAQRVYAAESIQVLLAKQSGDTTVLADAVRIERYADSRPNVPGVRSTGRGSGEPERPGRAPSLRAPDRSSVVAHGGGVGRNEQGP